MVAERAVASKVSMLLVGAAAAAGTFQMNARAQLVTGAAGMGRTVDSPLRRRWPLWRAPLPWLPSIQSSRTRAERRGRGAPSRSSLRGQRGRVGVRSGLGHVLLQRYGPWRERMDGKCDFRPNYWTVVALDFYFVNK